MADNYLERRMDEYRRSQPGVTVSHAHPNSSRLKKGQALIDYPSMRVLVNINDAETGKTLINTLRQLGCRIAFTAADIDNKTGNKLAQDTGSQYHTGTVDQACKRLEIAADPADVIIDISRPQQASLYYCTLNKLVDIPSVITHDDIHILANWCGYAIHPANRHVAIEISNKFCQK